MNIDITNFLNRIRKKKLPFYYAMTYATTYVANEIEEFRYRIREGQVVLHDSIHPSFTDISPGTELFKIVTLDLENTMEEFIASAKSKADNQKEFFPSGAMDRDDLVYITCIPWISFTQLIHTIHFRKDDSAPRISWGKYFQSGDKMMMPLSVQVNHALADGLHVGNYVNKLQEYINTL